MICLGCMKEKEDRKICNHCGFDEEKYLKEKPLVALECGHTFHNGKYTLGRVLGNPGGFGITYLGYDNVLQLKVAIKEYFPSNFITRTSGTLVNLTEIGNNSSFEKGKKKFLEEARLLAKLDNNYVVKVLNFFEENRTAYIVMAYYEGQTLTDYINSRGGKLDQDTSVTIAMLMLSGLSFVHKNNCLHRDIKPDNIYITKDGKPIILDFGAAKDSLARGSQTMSAVLTPGYAPFEQYSSESTLGNYTDIYSVGATLYAMLTGSVPPEAPSRIKNNRLKIKNCSPELEEIINKAMEFEYENRYQTAAEFINELRKITEFEVNEPQINKSKLNNNRNNKSIFIISAIAILIVVATGMFIFSRINSNTVLQNKTANVITEAAITRAVKPNINVTEKNVISPAITTETAITKQAISVTEVPKTEVSNKEISTKETVVKAKTEMTDNLIFVKGKDGINDFYISSAETTFEEYDAYCISENITKPDDSNFGRDKRPVINVSWIEAVKYCNWRSSKYKLAKAYKITSNGVDLIDKNGNATKDLAKVEGYRLPTEKEWEYASKGGNNPEDFLFSGSNDIKEVGWFVGNSDDKPQPVKQKNPNVLGIYDMSGNVWEWCNEVVVRGGGYNNRKDSCEINSAQNRILAKKNTKNEFYGFRVVKSK